MKKTLRMLSAAFWGIIALNIIIALTFESNILPCGTLAGQEGGSAEFVAATIMELVTICLIPFSLRLFKFRRVAKELTSADALRRMAMIRMSLLCIPMTVNTVLYYLFMNVAFGYMAIILFLCMLFIVPTKERCLSEIHTEDEQ